MAQRSVSAFKSTKNTRFADNTTGLITATNSRDMYEDTADSFLNKTDGGTVVGNIGIGSGTTPNAPLQFAGGAANRKIVINEDANNDHQYSGFGINSDGAVRYQVSDVSVGHLFYAGSSSTTSNELMRLTGGGKLGIGGVTPTAVLHLKAGTATANTAPLKLTTGTALTTPEDGALEYHSSHLYFTIGSTRYQLDQQATAGTYTPTLTSQQNVDSSSANLCQYMRVGSVVTVSGRISVDPTAGSSLTRISISLPVASAFADGNSCGGTALSTGGSTQGYIKPNTSNGAVDLEFTSTGTTNDTFYFIFNYLIADSLKWKTRHHPK